MDNRGGADWTGAPWGDNNTKNFYFDKPPIKSTVDFLYTLLQIKESIKSKCFLGHFHKFELKK